MIFNEQTKSVPITKMMVWEAYKKVKSNKGSAGVEPKIQGANHTRTAKT
jgi:RNA-directed DNA polymerase